MKKGSNDEGGGSVVKARARVIIKINYEVTTTERVKKEAKSNKSPRTKDAP
jgi:hypothetical protein